MKIIIKMFLITAMIFVAASFTTAQSLTTAENEYNSQLQYYLNNSTDTNNIVVNLERIITETTQMTDFNSLYLHSKILLLKGIILAESGNEADSVFTLESAQSAADRAIQLNDNADCWRIKGEAGSAIMLQKGVSYIIANGGKVEEYIDNAIELDKQNIRAQVLKAQSLINKPFIFGGSVKKGVKLLSELNEKDSGSKADRFFILYNLSIGLQKQKKTDDAIEICRKALVLYPDNLDAGELLSELSD